MINANFAPLCGIFCAGYSCSLPIIRSNKDPSKNTRDVFIRYFLVFMSFVICGSLGYIGFLGTKFEDYFINNATNPTGLAVLGEID